MGETERPVFQILCEMQRGLDLLRPDYTKERGTSENETIVLGFDTERKWR